MKIPHFSAVSRCVAALIAVGAASCVYEGPALSERDYLLVGTASFRKIPGAAVRLSIHDDGLVFSAGCNRYEGGYTVDDSRLVVEGLSSTEIGCRTDLLELDARLAAFFLSKPRVAEDGLLLSLRGEGAILHFIAREHSEPQRSLSDGIWAIDGSIAGDEASSIELDEPAALHFRSGGVLGVFTGCARGTGRYRVEDETLVLSAVAYEATSCTDRTKATDQAVRSVIGDGELTFEIVHRRLMIERGDQGLYASLQ